LVWPITDNQNIHPDAQIISILDHMSHLEEARQQDQDQKNRKRIGFKTSKDQQTPRIV